MSDKKTISKTYDLLHYCDEWDKLKSDFSLTDESLHEAVEEELQLRAWGDIFNDVRGALELEQEEN
jgi:hypothetical protein